jgi:hypothetical protein
MKRKYLFFLIAVILFLSKSTSAAILCTFFDICPDRIIDGAINDLEKTSENWKKVLEETRDKLIKEGRETLAHEVSLVLEKFSGDFFRKSSCFTDFVMRKAIEVDLLGLKAKVVDNNIKIPIICDPDPSSINYKLVQEGRLNEIDLNGYNLDSVNIKVFLLDNKGEERDMSSYLANPSSFLLNINLGKNGIPLDSNSQKIILRFNFDAFKKLSNWKEIKKLIDEKHLNLSDRSINIIQPRQGGQPTKGKYDWWKDSENDWNWN